MKAVLFITGSYWKLACYR